MARLEMTGYDVGESAAAGGTPDALFELGLMYCAGRDVEMNLISAHKWFNLAAMRGNQDARRSFTCEFLHVNATYTPAAGLTAEWSGALAARSARA